MAAVTIQKEQYLFHTGEPVTKLYLILKGSFLVTFPGGSYTLSKGEAAGICAADSDVHDTTCQALEDSSVLVYPVSGLSSLETLFRESADYGVLFARSAFRQANQILRQHELAQITCSSLYTGSTQDYGFYLSCCMRHQLKPRKLSSLSGLSPFDEDSVAESWVPAYYDGFQRLLSSPSGTCLGKEPAVLTGLLAGICMDCRRFLSSLEGLAEYQKQAVLLYLNSDLEDLFDLYTALYFKLGPDSSDSDALYERIDHMIHLIEESSCADSALSLQRFGDFKECLKSLQPGKKSPDTAKQDSLASEEQLNGSLQTILDYSEAEDSLSSDFKKLILQYKGLTDKNATDDDSRMLRQKITTLFYQLYGLVFNRAKSDLSMPLPVRMFLYFGYVDEQLAETKNALYLGHLAGLLASTPHEQVYTLYDWLLAVFSGQKESSRNEFDQDYTDYLHSLKVTGKIDAAKETALSADMSKRVEYELQNMFPVVNKMTFGRISTFCPVFSAHNILKHLDASYVSEARLKTIFSEIEAIDYSAFYREYVYTNIPAGIPKEFFHTKVLPDVILMPGIGTRGVMWQEIEGRRRTTAARMMLPIFYLEDLRSAVVRLTGEYRWEMCKRIQGARWNDLSDRSLTSEYFDYIQFYRKNHDLSADTKERIKAALQKARGSFKEMFVRDYITYILFEGTGSPRLTKTARTILFTYCPFAKDTRDSLQNNPIYKEILDHFTIQRTQQLHKLSLLEKRVENSGVSLPEDLENERIFLES